MSKLKDALDGLGRNSKAEEDTGDYIQEELAKTFFAPSGKKPEKSKKVPKIAYMVTGIALLLALFIIILNNYIDIKVNIRRELPIPVQVQAPIQTETFFIKDGKPNPSVIRNTLFMGDARKFSREKDDMLILVNSKGAGWANFSVELKEPMNMEGLYITYKAMGQVDAERLILTFTDSNNKTYRMARTPQSALTKEWKGYTVDLAPAGGAIDLKNILIIRLEFGSLTAGNNPGDTIFLKDIKITKKRDEKWL